MDLLYGRPLIRRNVREGPDKVQRRFFGYGGQALDFVRAEDAPVALITSKVN